MRAMTVVHCQNGPRENEELTCDECGFVQVLRIKSFPNYSPAPMASLDELVETTNPTASVKHREELELSDRLSKNRLDQAERLKMIEDSVRGIEAVVMRYFDTKKITSWIITFVALIVAPVIMGTVWIAITKEGAIGYTAPIAVVIVTVLLVLTIRNSGIDAFRPELPQMLIRALRPLEPNDAELEHAYDEANASRLRFLIKPELLAEQFVAHEEKAPPIQKQPWIASTAVRGIAVVLLFASIGGGVFLVITEREKEDPSLKQVLDDTGKKGGPTVTSLERRAELARREVEEAKRLEAERLAREEAARLAAIPPEPTEDEKKQALTLGRLKELGRRLGAHAEANAGLYPDELDNLIRDDYRRPEMTDGWGRPFVYHGEKTLRPNDRKAGRWIPLLTMAKSLPDQSKRYVIDHSGALELLFDVTIEKQLQAAEAARPAAQALAVIATDKREEAKPWSPAIHYTKELDRKSEQNIRRLAGELQAFGLAQGDAYPDDLEGFIETRRDKSILTDAWGRPFVYIAAGRDIRKTLSDETTPVLTTHPLPGGTRIIQPAAGFPKKLNEDELVKLLENAGIELPG